MTVDQRQTWGWVYYVLTLCAGTVGIIITKRISKETSPLPGTDPSVMDYFQHPYMMTLFMFIGELLCLPLFYISRLFISQKTKGNRINPLLCAIPALCDAVGSALAYNAYNFMAVSIIQMLSGLRLIVITIFSRLFLKAPLYIHQIVGMLIVFFGMAIVGFSAYIDTSGESQPIGFLFLALSYLLSPIQFIVEEAILINYTVNPLEIIGYEGIFGFLFVSLLLIMFQNIPCTRVGKLEDINVYPQSAYCPYGKMEDTYVGFFQLKNSPTIMQFVMLMIVALCILNFSSVGVSKHLKSRVRSTMSVTQNIVIWLISIIFQWEQFNYLQFIGFVLSSLGVIIYNEIYVPSIGGLNYYTKENIAKREKIK